MKKMIKNINPRLLLGIGAGVVLVCMVLGVAAWTAVNNPAFASFIGSAPAAPVQEESHWAQVEVAKPLAGSFDISALSPQTVDTPIPQVGSPDPADGPAPASTAVPTTIPTEAPTTIPEAAETPGQMMMDIVENTPTSEYIPLPTSESSKPAVASSGNGTRWIDVDLTNQRVYAYEGDTVVNSFIVSTGTWLTPTVTGQFNVYVKYRSNKMSGPGYYLPDVPYIMYFYGSYGLHGTYWHNNFGTPMSHGCVNLPIDDAGWLYNWASVGTVVNVHY
jgi:lipoprotein-anchoring transpeptidase ErfK/SrfK